MPQLKRPTPIRVQPAYKVTVQQPKTSAIMAGWVVLILGFVLALVPGIGLSMIIISIPVCFSGLILGVIGAAKGKPFWGVFLIVSSIAAFFLFQIIPWISSLIGLAASQPNGQ